jgi:hypothetical protein
MPRVHPRYNPKRDGRPQDGKCEGCESLYVIHLYTRIANRRAESTNLIMMRRELVERNGIGESADAVWKALNQEHQKLFPVVSETEDEVAAPALDGNVLRSESDASRLVEELVGSSSLPMFGQRPGSGPGRRARAKAPVPEQSSLFG